MKRSDWLWLLAFPVYLIFGTIRHEGAHAISALLQGAQVTEFVVIPGWHDQQLIFGYVRYHGNITWVTTAAPYLFDLLTYTLIFPIGMRVVFQRHWVWLNVIILGLISPMVNSLYQYLKPSLGLRGDVAGLFEMLPAYAVHAYFLLTLLGYTYGLALVFRRSRHLAANSHKTN